MQGMPQGFTPGGFTPSAPIRPVPERGTWLTVYIALITFGGFIGLAASLFGFAALKHISTNADPDAVAVTAVAMKLALFAIVVSSAQIACAYGIWTWKKWGIVGYLAMSAVGLMISIKAGQGHGLSFISLMMMGFLVRTAVQKWSFFE